MIDRDEALAKLTAPGQPWELQDVEVKGHTKKWFVNGPQSLKQLVESSICDDVYFVYENERYTFRDVYKKASSFAYILKREYKVQPGDRVAIAMRNYPEWPIAVAAITSIGAVAVGVNAWWESDEIDYALKLTGVTVVIADKERLERIQRISPEPNIKLISVRAGEVGYATAIDDLLKLDESMPEVDVDPDSDAVILFTSGSTGHPKGSVSTHRNILAALLSWEVDLQAVAMVQDIDLNEESLKQPVLLSMPLFHVNGLLYVLFYSLLHKRKIVSMFKWDPAIAADLIEKEKIATAFGTPAMTGDLVEYARKENKDLSSLQAAGGGGAPRAKSQVEGIDKVFKNAVPYTGWGMTETNSIGTGISGQDYLDNPHSSGKCSVVLEIATIDEEGNFLPENTRGELVVRGTSVIHGYWNRPDANRESFIGDWFRTGDIAYIDKEGYLYIVDRLKQLIIRGGENIGCGEVEDALLEHKDVVEASVYGVPDERLGEVVATTLSVDSSIHTDDLISFLNTKLAKFKIPQYIKTTSEPLPRIASGKIDKRQLRNIHIGELEAL